MSIVLKQRPISAAAHHRHFSAISACMRCPLSDKPKEAADAPSTTSTSVYATDFGACVLTWTRTLLGRTLRIQLQGEASRCGLDHALKIRSKPFLLWRNRGSKAVGEVRILWDFARCRFGSETEPDAGFYLAVVVGGEVAVLVGDLVKAAYGRLRLRCRDEKWKQRLVLRKEHVHGTRFYRATAAIGDGRTVMILIEHFYTGRDSGLRFSFNGFRALEVERLVWKFRGSERVQVDGAVVNVSWDVHGWLFGERSKKRRRDAEDADAGAGAGSGSVFVFDFEELVGAEEGMRRSEGASRGSISSSRSSWGSSSSAVDWWSVGEKEMDCGGAGVGFSLVVYASKC